MSEQPDENNLLRARFEDQRKRKFEKDKARKSKDSCSPWPVEAWQAAWAASAADVKREPRFPIIITDFLTPQKVQELAGLSSLPETKWTITTGFADKELDNPEELQYCIVNGYAQLDRVERGSIGKEVRVWCEGKKIITWSAHAEAQKIDGTKTTDH
ncbi:hypothetical protein BDV36DRAFT_275886 [Aspergillus pseudocaelatus]|uniref:Uncharacterized protein n=1 Tax=Aspergillus pseudocaelatus TaxID=1825620 RepID=A0ABQ6W1N8_9EURO|nr:hypothetical protein BDV36DRAFT_275886 [Aspergillus pseudocaelatus]